MKNVFKQLRNPKVLKILIAFVVLALVTGAYVFYEKTTNRVFIDDSLVSAPVINVAPSTSGKETELDVYENQQVKKGDPLAVIGSETLYADTDGLIIAANNQTGSLVSPTTTVVQMINLLDMRIAGTIDENKGLNTIEIGQVVSFTVDALPGKTFWGYVDEISPSAKQTQLSFSISSERPTQQFIVYAKYDAKAYPEIKNGMSAKMIVYTK